MASCLRKQVNILGTWSLVGLWLFHFTIGIFLHYHPEYTHAHTGALEPHKHHGHFHSEEMEQLAEWIQVKPHSHPHGETHHHNDTGPGSDPENIQFHGNKDSLPTVKKGVNSPGSGLRLDHLSSAPHTHVGVHEQAPLRKILNLPTTISERAPPSLRV